MHGTCSALYTCPFYPADVRPLEGLTAAQCQGGCWRRKRSCDRLRVGHGEGLGIALGIELCVVLVASALCRDVCDHSFLYICGPSWGWQACLLTCFSQVGSPIAGPGVIHGLCPPLIIIGVLSIHFEDTEYGMGSRLPRHTTLDLKALQSATPAGQKSGPGTSV